jgi:hypothetical protein
MHDLATDAKYAATLKRMLDLLAAARKEYGDEQ